MYYETHEDCIYYRQKKDDGGYYPHGKEPMIGLSSKPRQYECVIRREEKPNCKKCGCYIQDKEVSNE